MAHLPPLDSSQQKHDPESTKRPSLLQDGTKSGIPVPRMLLLFPSLRVVLVPNPPETRQTTEYTGQEGNVVSGPIAVQTLRARPLTAGLHLGMSVVDRPVAEVVDVAAHDGGKRHEAPIDRKPRSAKGIRDERREH